MYHVVFKDAKALKGVYPGRATACWERCFLGQVIQYNILAQHGVGFGVLRLAPGSGRW
jgi:hypothetical protein